MDKGKNYHKCLVFYIDILGTKEADFKSLVNINRIFRALLNEGKKNDEAPHNEHSIYKRYIFSFSDCACIVFDYKEGTEEYKKNDAKLALIALYDTYRIFQKLLDEGYTFRGGISFDDVYYNESENIIFGPALSESYKLESKEAVYPRILIEKGLAKKIDEYSVKIDINSIGRYLENVKRNIVFKDTYNEYCFNYLNYVDDLIGGSTRIENIANTIIEGGANKFKDRNFHVLEKYTYLYDYFCSQSDYTIEQDNHNKFTEYKKHLEEYHVKKKTIDTCCKFISKIEDIDDIKNVQAYIKKMVKK